jgi:hypothetical protein
VTKGVLFCDDGNPCTNDGCDPATGCTYANNQAACIDGNACTLGDICVDGDCEPGGNALACADGNPCTSDSCDPATGCLFENNSLQCDDSNACTQLDVCSGGGCIGSDELNCDDQNSCTTDSCDAVDGCLSTGMADETPCAGADEAYCQNATCVCKPGYAGDIGACEDVDECANGANNCDGNATCTNTPGSFSCACNNGYVGNGITCDKPLCGNSNGGNLTKDNGTGTGILYCYNGGDSVESRAKKACESHHGEGACCVITGGYNSQQYGQCGGGGGGYHWHPDSWPNGHCGPNYGPGDVINPGWCGSITGNFL